MLHSLIPGEIEDNAYSANFFGGKKCIVWDMQMANTKEFYQTNKKRELNLSTLVKGSPCSYIVTYYVLLAILNFRALQEREVSKEIVEKLVVL